MDIHTRSSTRVYISVPIDLALRAMQIETLIREAGYVPLNPCLLNLPDIDKRLLPAIVANSCYELIDSASAIVLHADRYGRDCAAEIGYAFARKIPVIGLATTHNRSLIAADWMIRPRLTCVVSRTELPTALSELLPVHSSAGSPVGAQHVLVDP